MEDRQDFALQGRPKVDQHIAATDKVQPGEGRILGQVVSGENAYVADELGDLVTAFRSGEEPRQSLRRDIGQRGVGVRPGAGLLDRRFAEIGGENLERKVNPRLLQEFYQAHGDRISFLAGGTPGHPDPDWVARRSFLGQGGKNLVLQFFEDLRLPKEFGHGDEKALVQSVHLVAISFEVQTVVFQVFESTEVHSTVNAPLKGVVPIVAEVHSGGAAQYAKYRVQFRSRRLFVRLSRLDRDTGIASQSHQFPGDSGRREYKIHHSGGDGASRHAVEPGGSRFLSEGDSARGLDRLEAKRPIRRGARQDDADRVGAAIRGEGA